MSDLLHLPFIPEAYTPAPKQGRPIKGFVRMIERVFGVRRHLQGRRLPTCQHGILDCTCPGRQDQRSPDLSSSDEEWEVVGDMPSGAYRL
jgi:hypothetical protein